MTETKYWICTILIVTIIVIIYHLIIVLTSQNNIKEDNIIFFGIPGGPKPPKHKDIDYEKKMTGLAYIYDSRIKTYKSLKDENGDKIMLDDINFSDDYIIDSINQYRMRNNQTKISKNELISLAKNLGYNTKDKKGAEAFSQVKLNNDFLNQSSEFKNLYINNMTTEDLYN